MRGSCSRSRRPELKTRASHYQPQFSSRADAGRYYTRDKERSPLISQRSTLEFENTVDLPGLRSLRVVAAVGSTLYLYSDFPPFRRLQAIEATFGLVAQLAAD